MNKELILALKKWAEAAQAFNKIVQEQIFFSRPAAFVDCQKSLQELGEIIKKMVEQQPS